MQVFVDTNVFVAAVTDEPDLGAVASDLLDSDHEFVTSVLNLMELRTVLTKKRRLEQDRVGRIIREILGDVDVVIHDTSDMIDANRLQEETLLYPLDCLILAVARAHDATLVSFDSELVDAGAVHPQDLL